jgi:hypothetical protein
MLIMLTTSSTHVRITFFLLDKGGAKGGGFARFIEPVVVE